VVIVNDLDLLPKNKWIKPPVVMAIDLEMNQPSCKIIELGYCVGNYETGEILEQGTTLIDPGEPLKRADPNIKFDLDIPELCNIWRAADGETNIKRRRIIPIGASLVDAHRQVVSVHEKHNCLANLVTWGGGDTETYNQQARIAFGNKQEFYHWPFGRRYIDVKTLALEILRAQGQRPAGGLSKTMLKFGLAFQGRKHQAVDDAVNTFLLFAEAHKLLKDVKLKIRGK
jgi:hypothetical protein